MPGSLTDQRVALLLPRQRTARVNRHTTGRHEETGQDDFPPIGPAVAIRVFQAEDVGCAREKNAAVKADVCHGG